MRVRRVKINETTDQTVVAEEAAAVGLSADPASRTSLSQPAGAARRPNEGQQRGTSTWATATGSPVRALVHAGANFR